VEKEVAREPTGGAGLQPAAAGDLVVLVEAFEGEFGDR
jgi:hypothetical protein